MINNLAKCQPNMQSKGRITNKRKFQCYTKLWHFVVIENKKLIDEELIYRHHWALQTYVTKMNSKDGQMTKESQFNIWLQLILYIDYPYHIQFFWRRGSLIQFNNWCVCWVHSWLGHPKKEKKNSMTFLKLF